MLTPDSPTNDSRSLVVKPQPIELVLYEEGLSPLAIVLPPYEDIAEIKSLQNSNFSLRESGDDYVSKAFEGLLSERATLESKRMRFGSSPTFLNRLATLAGVGGDYEEEARLLEQMLEVHRDQFGENRLGDNILARLGARDAADYFTKLDLEVNSHANLRLASFHVMSRNLEAALPHVEQALRIDPLDFSARLFDGALRLFMGEYERAVRSFKIAQEERPNSSTLLVNMAIAYLKLDKPKIALSCLKRAVAVDPISANAVSLLADVAYAEDLNEEAVPSLRYFIRFEQKSPGMWSRLARALMGMGELNEAIAALKRQGSAEDSSDVWNNLGVAYFLKKDYKRALESFKHAMSLSDGYTDYAFCVAAKNAAGVMLRLQLPSDVLRFIELVVHPKNEGLFCAHRDLAQIFLVQLNALVKIGASEAAAALGESLLARSDCSGEFRGEVALGLMTHYALNREYQDKALATARHWAAGLSSVTPQRLRSQLTNNIAFVFVEAGRLDEARPFLQHLSSLIHVEPYPTATLGLYHIRRGHALEGEVLYQEAIRLAVSSEDKARIRQKWNLERAQLVISQDPRKAKKYLERARDETEGEPAISRRAKQLLLTLS